MQRSVKAYQVGSIPTPRTMKNNLGNYTHQVESPDKFTRFDLTEGSCWFKEKITRWEPESALAFELYECTLPVKMLKHSYTITRTKGKTRVSQVMEYEMKFGVFGKVMDSLMVRKKWNDGIKKFFSGLKHYIEHEN